MMLRPSQLKNKNKNNTSEFSKWCMCLFCEQLKVTDYHVKSTVVSRYAVTTVQSSVWNQLPIIKEAAFEVDLPSSAFISNFTMWVHKQHVSLFKF